MPIIDSHIRFAEMAVRYQAGGGESMAATDYNPSPWLSDVVVTLCHRILSQEPHLVNQLAEGKADRKVLSGLIQKMLEQEPLHVACDQDRLYQQVQDFLFGYGPLQSYIEDEDISDIDGTGPAEFTLTCRGERQKLNLRFPSAKAYDTFCRLVIIRNGGIINENDSHCRVADPRFRLRINVTVPPRSLRHATISIRKHRRKAWSLQDLTDRDMLQETMLQQIRGLADSDASILFSGKGAAGKTTLMRAFINAMPPLERVLIAESDRELYPDKPCCLVQKIKKENEGGHPIRLGDLIADGLTMSLDTYCIGEIVGQEAMDLLRAAHSGHRCLATIHAGSAVDALDRLLSLARSAERNVSEALIEQMIGRSFHYIIHLQDFKVTQICRVHPANEGGKPYVLDAMAKTKEATSADFVADQFTIPLDSGS